MATTTFKHFKFRPTEHPTIEAIKRQYHRLAMRWHPDRDGGDLNTMQEINAEFDQLRKRYYNVHEGKNGETYTDENQTTTTDVDDRFIEIIDMLIKMDGVGIEICGKFVWLSGNTYEYRDEIKAMGARWAKRKRMWYIAPNDWEKQRGHNWSMERIRGKYGSQVVREGKRPKRKVIAA